MKVLHVGTLAATAGGPAMSTYFTLLGLRQQGIDAEIIQFPLTKNDILRGEEVPVHYTKSPWEHKFCYTPSYKNDILKLGKYDIYHAQGVWQWPTYALVDTAQQIGKPYLITPRGMLYPQDIAKSNTMFKKLSLKLRLLQDLNNAACIHVTCMDELHHCRKLGITSPIGIIPNPVEIKKYPCYKQDEKFRLGYLGRISRRKNIQGLIQACINLGEEMKDKELLIIGDGDKEYMEELHKLANQIKYGTIRFTGFLNGKEKDEALASCSVLVMPSEFVNLGNVILEGLVRKIPCIATTGSPWEELKSYQCGWWVTYNQDSITEAIQQAINTPHKKLKDMGERGRELMERHYSVEAVATKMKRLYKWILKEEEKPEFVY